MTPCNYTLLPLWLWVSSFSHHKIWKGRELHPLNNWDFCLFSSAAMDPLIHLIQPNCVQSSVTFVVILSNFLKVSETCDLWIRWLYVSITWWLNFWVNLTGPQGAQRFRQTLWLVSRRNIKIRNIEISRWRKADWSSSYGCATSN